MSMSVAREPFTRVEFAFGGIAVAAIVLITLLGSRFSQPLVSQALVSQPVSQPSQDLPTIASPNAPTGARQWHRAPGAAARELSSQPFSQASDGVAVPTGPGAFAPNPAVDGRAGVVVMQQPAEAMPAEAPLSTGPIDQPPPVPPWRQTREASVHSSPATERDTDNRSDARFIQRRLRELGYYSGGGNGVWGAASRNALRDFKTMNGLQADDRWDRE